jgi:hypothetical protein
LDIKLASRLADWSIAKTIPNLFPQKTISLDDFNQSLGEKLKFNKQESFELIKDMKKHGILDFQPSKGRLIFK